MVEKEMPISDIQLDEDELNKMIEAAAENSLLVCMSDCEIDIE